MTFNHHSLSSLNKWHIYNECLKKYSFQHKQLHCHLNKCITCILENVYTQSITRKAGNIFRLIFITTNEKSINSIVVGFRNV